MHLTQWMSWTASRRGLNAALIGFGCLVAAISVQVTDDFGLGSLRLPSLLLTAMRWFAPIIVGVATTATASIACYIFAGARD